MNQILSTESNSKSKKKKRNNNLLDMRKFIIIFSILIVIFALVAVGVKIYNIVAENIKNNLEPIELLNKPTINIERVDDVCVLTVNYDEGLDKITYYWNSENVIEKNMNGSTTPFITQIVIPEGYNTLYVKATGIDGSINETEETFGVENKPVISWYYNEETRKIEIIAKSDKGIQSIVYEWEGEETVTIEAPEENTEELTATIDVKRGTNKITITAIDSEGNTQIKSDKIQATLAPVIRVQLVNNKTITLNVSHDMGFKKVVMNVNGSELIYDESNPSYSKDIKSLDTSIDVEPGTVTVKISVYTLEEEEKEYTYEASTEIIE